MDYKDVLLKRNELRERATQYVYYAIIVISSLIALIFLPLLSVSVGLEWKLPTTTVGWVIYIFTRICVAVINVLIFYSFMQQAKINVKTDEHYIEANAILNKIQTEKAIYRPRSPKEFNKKEYSSKGISIFISTALATVALTQALLAYDYVTMLTYLITIVMGCIFGVLQMLKAEEYWTVEYYDYAKMLEKETFGEVSEKPKEEKNEIIGELQTCLTLVTKNSET